MFFSSEGGSCSYANSLNGRSLSDERAAILREVFRAEALCHVCVTQGDEVARGRFRSKDQSQTTTDKVKVGSQYRLKALSYPGELLAAKREG